MQESWGGTDGSRLFKVARGELELFLFLSEGPNDVSWPLYCAVAERLSTEFVLLHYFGPICQLTPGGPTATMTKKTRHSSSLEYLWDVNERVSHDLKALQHKGLRHAKPTFSALCWHGKQVFFFLFFLHCRSVGLVHRAPSRRSCICSAGSEPRMENAHLNNGRR